MTTFVGCLTKVEVGEVILELLKWDQFSVFFVCDCSIRRCATGRGYGKGTWGFWRLCGPLGVWDPPKLIRRRTSLRLPVLFKLSVSHSHV